MLRLALAVVLVAGCQTARPPADEAPRADARADASGAGDTLSVRLGATALRDGHTVGFTRVLDDSRCPADVTCVWEGRARVEVTLDGVAAELTLPYASRTDAEPTRLERGGIAVEAVGLDPYPGTPEARAGAPATLRLVTRAASM